MVKTIDRPHPSRLSHFKVLWSAISMGHIGWVQAKLCSGAGIYRAPLSTRHQPQVACSHKPQESQYQPEGSVYTRLQGQARPLFIYYYPIIKHVYLKCSAICGWNLNFTEKLPLLRNKAVIDQRKALAVIQIHLNRTQHRHHRPVKAKPPAEHKHSVTQYSTTTEFDLTTTGCHVYLCNILLYM